MSSQPPESMAVGTNLPQVKKPNKDEQAIIKCPRCDSTKTKFCYYNNYSLSQPRNFCKSCKRYWTAGGTLKNVKVGEGSRKNKRSSSSSSSSSSSKINQENQTSETTYTKPLSTPLSPTPLTIDFVRIQQNLRIEQMGFFDSMLGNNNNNNPSVNLSSFSSVLETAAPFHNNFYSGSMVDTRGQMGNTGNGGIEINICADDFEATGGMSRADAKTASSTAISSSTAKKGFFEDFQEW